MHLSNYFNLISRAFTCSKGQIIYSIQYDFLFFYKKHKIY